MNTAFIAAGVLLAATLANLPEASAKSAQFSLTFAGPNGLIQISGPGRGSKHGSMGKGYGSQGYGHGYGRGYGYGRGNGYGQPYNGPFNLRRARANGYCLYPNEIRHRLAQQGWHGFKVKKLTPRIAFVKSRYHGTRYRLKVDRCTGQVLKARPLGGYGGYGGYGYY